MKSDATDSAAAVTALHSGVKIGIGRTSVSTSGDRLFTMGDKARDLGKAVGAVSTVWVSHATPGAWYAHNDDRNNGYAIADEGFLGDLNTTGSYSGSHGPTLAAADVIIGARVESYINSAIRDKLFNESGDPGKHTLLERIAGSPGGGPRLLAAADDPSVTRLAALNIPVLDMVEGRNDE